MIRRTLILIAFVFTLACAGCCGGVEIDFREGTARAGEAAKPYPPTNKRVRNGEVQEPVENTDAP